MTITSEIKLFRDCWSLIIQDQKYVLYVLFEIQSQEKWSSYKKKYILCFLNPSSYIIDMPVMVLVVGGIGIDGRGGVGGVHGGDGGGLGGCDGRGFFVCSFYGSIYNLIN